MAKNDDEDKKVQKKYAAETRGMPANLARIAARNLAAEDARISRLNEIRGRIEENLPENVAARAARYREPVFDAPSSIPADAPPGRYATGVVGTPLPAGVGPPREQALRFAQEYAKGFGGGGTITATPGGFQFTPYKTGGVVTPEETPGLGSFLSQFVGVGFPELASQYGRIGRGIASQWSARSFFPAIQSFFNSARPRPYNPAPPLRNVSAPPPSFSFFRPSTWRDQPENPYYAESPPTQ